MGLLDSPSCPAASLRLQARVRDAGQWATVHLAWISPGRGRTGTSREPLRVPAAGPGANRKCRGCSGAGGDGSETGQEKQTNPEGVVRSEVRDEA